MTKKAYTMATHCDIDGEVTYRVKRNYKNGKSRYIGRPYKTMEGAMRIVRHRNACHFDKYCTEFVRQKPRMDSRDYRELAKLVNYLEEQRLGADASLVDNTKQLESWIDTLKKLARE